MPEETLRPGLAGGLYPERRDPTAHPFERMLEGLRGSWVRWREGRLAGLREVAHQVEARAADLAIDSDERLQRAPDGLRRRLARDGLTDALCRLRDDREFTTSLGQNGRQKFLTTLTIDASAEAIRDLYHSLPSPQ